MTLCRFLCVCLGWAVLSVSISGLVRADQLDLIFAEPETAGISGSPAYWNTPVVLAENGASRVIDRGEFGAAPSAIWDPAERRDGRQPGALVFDALHRSLLVRFPGSAEAVAEKLRQGYAIKRVELELPFRDTEFWPFDYVTPAGLSFMGARWVNRSPRWHALGWPLRRPWQADLELGPTFNAWINGAGYWTRFGATDEEHDRYPQAFGPVEVSYRERTGYDREVEKKTEQRLSPDRLQGQDALDQKFDSMLGNMLAEDEFHRRPARMDITAVLTDDDYGATPAERLRNFEAQGMLLAKWETYDLRYKDLYSGYEWGTATGGRGILINTPRLIVTLEKISPPESPGALPPAVDVPALAARLKTDGGAGQPTAVLPSREVILEQVESHGLSQQSWMTDWQWQRVRELATIGDEPGIDEFPGTEEAYRIWIDQLMALTPRHFIGHRTPRYAGVAWRYREVLPPPVLEHLKRYWEGWLMPHRSYRELVHAQDGEKQRDFLRETDDWRGNTSYYRGGYTRTMSTMNFNHTAIAGALLGGALIESEYAVDDGRHGLEHFPLRLWSWLDGSTQETIDHYYLGITLFSIKDIADFAPDPLDRLMARSALTKYMENMTSVYHPRLRQFASTSSRTGSNHIWVTQEGTRHIMHTLSETGALRDMGLGVKHHGMPVIGHDYPPREVAFQTLAGPWGPLWLTNHVDHKPIPFEATSTFKQWGQARNNPMIRRTYLGHNYGMASQDRGGGRFRFLVQWSRDDEPVGRIEELGTLMVRPGANLTEFLGGEGGTLEMEGRKFIFHHKNTAMVLTTPADKRKEKDTLRSLQTTVAFFDFRPKPGWTIWADGKRITQLPAELRFGQPIVVEDGDTYIGLIPIPGTDLGREIEVLIRLEDNKVELFTGCEISATMVVEVFNMKKPLTRQDAARQKPPAAPSISLDAMDGFDEGLDLKLDQTLDALEFSDVQNKALKRLEERWNTLHEAFGGVIVRMADRHEFPSAQAFMAHLKASKLEVKDDSEDRLVARISYRDGADGDLMETGFRLGRGGFIERKVNGENPYLPQGIDRDTPFSIQGDTGQLDKNGFVLRSRPGAMMFLQTDPLTGGCLAMNPLPDLQPFALVLPDGVEITADGLLGLTFIETDRTGRRIVMDHGFKPAQAEADGIAKTLLVFGLKDKPEVVLNGVVVPQARITPARVDGREAWAIGLKQTSDVITSGLDSRFRAHRDAFVVISDSK